MSAPRDFGFDAPLTQGISLLEASARTGKTFQITNLVLRLLTQPEQPVRMGELLVVTFTNAATAELVDRIRGRLALAVGVYRSQVLGMPYPEGRDPESLRPLVEAARDSGELGEYLRLLERAQEEFDQATISTIHGFCQRMLRQNAFESMADFDLELIQDEASLIEEIVDDFLSSQVNTADKARYRFFTEDCKFTRDKLIKLVKAAVQEPRMTVEPSPADEDRPLPVAERLSKFADWWEQKGMTELAQAMDKAYQDGKIVPAKKKGGERAGSQSTYASKKCLSNGQTLLTWVRSVLAGGQPSPCPQANYWGATNIRNYSPGPHAWHHPHLNRVRAALDPSVEEASYERARFVSWAREALRERHEAQRTMSFQDLLRQLADRLKHPEQAGPLKLAIGSAYRVALIDEFQDTDPVQWGIFRALFGEGKHHLYLIGDPKQAIYRFRGANVNAYLEAKKAASNDYTMRVNYRSDARLLAALNPVLAAPFPADARPDNKLGHEGMFGLDGITYEPVSAPQDRKVGARLSAPESGSELPAGTLAPLQLRFLDQRLDPLFTPDGSTSTQITTGLLNKLLPRRVAADIVALLKQKLRLYQEKKESWRTLSPGDIAVLVRSGKQARAVQGALLEAGVPCVLPRTDTVFASDEAAELQLWLDAVRKPGSDGAARAAYTTVLFGGTAEKLKSLDRDDDDADHSWWDEWLGQLAQWQGSLEKHGVLRAFRKAMSDQKVQATLLARRDGERRLTNLLHLLELLHAAQVHQHLGLSSLILWLAEQRRNAKAGSDTGELRLERDDEAVRIMNMHKAKGLQFPVVFAPSLWGQAKGGGDALVISKDEGSPERVLDVHLDATVEPKRSRTIRDIRENWQDELRLLYVALTRAEQRCVIYTGDINGLATSAVGTLLHAFTPGTSAGSVGDRLEAARKRIEKMGSQELWDDLQALAARAGEPDPHGQLIHVSRCEPVSEPAQWTMETDDRTQEDFDARLFERFDRKGRPKNLDRTWKRTSYTGITKSRSHKADEEIEQAAMGRSTGISEQAETAKDHDQDVSIEAVRGSGLDPEVEAELRAQLPTDEVAREEVPLAQFPAGADAGTFLHELFEHLDFSPFAHAEDDVEGQELARAELERVIRERGPLHGFGGPRHRELLSSGIPPVLRTPLGGELGELRLADIPKHRRLDELVFDLPLAGGDDHRRPNNESHRAFTKRISGAAFGEAFQLGKGDGVPRDVYLDKLAKGWVKQHFAGYLTGSIDLVFATPTALESDPERFYVLDYKSNRLDLLRDRETTRGHFCRAWMRHEMEHHDYIVQAYLYSLALHRFLRQRKPKYKPEEHLGGALYLFVRGMVGPEKPTDNEHPYGVFFLRPNLDVIRQLDQLFDAASASTGGVS